MPGRTTFRPFGPRSAPIVVAPGTNAGMMCGATNKTVLVAGGTGLVGEAVVRALCTSPGIGRVFVSSRTRSRLRESARRLRDLAPRATMLEGDAGDAAGAAGLIEAVIEDAGRLDAAVASLGSGVAGGRPVSDFDRASYDALMHDLLGAHVVFARAALPRLAPGGIYLNIGGGAAFAPMRGGGIISIAAAGQVMFTRVLEAERTRPDLTIRELLVNAPVTDGARNEIAAAVTPDDVARVVEELLLTGSPGWPRLRKKGPILTMDP